MSANSFLTRGQSSEVAAAIADAEKNTSGEIRVHIEAKCGEDVKASALKSFEKLGMARTAARNGVLIYVAYESRKLAILGDKGINDLVPHDFWKDCCEQLQHDFSEGRNTEGLVKVVTMVGEKLKAFFPYLEDDRNELSDDVSFGDENQEISK